MSEDLDKLDRLAAEKIMGWTAEDEEGGLSWTFKERATGYYVNKDDDWKWDGWEHWSPTRNIAQAWELLEKFPSYQIFCRFGALPKHECVVYTSEDQPLQGVIPSAETAPLSIVKACLRAKGIEF